MKFSDVFHAGALKWFPALNGGVVGVIAYAGCDKSMMYAEEAFNSTSVYTQLLHLATKNLTIFQRCQKSKSVGARLGDHVVTFRTKSNKLRALVARVS
jgi:hypothetical protein